MPEIKDEERDLLPANESQPTLELNCVTTIAPSAIVSPDIHAEFTRVSDLIGSYQSGSTMPERETAIRIFQQVLKVLPANPRQIECALPEPQQQPDFGFRKAEEIASLYFVDDSRRTYCFVHDDFRQAVQMTIVARDHSKDDLSQFSAITFDEQGKRIDFPPGPHAEQLYQMLGDLHKGSNCGFFGL